MALVTVQRSPTPSATSSPCASEADSGEDDPRFQPRSISESFLTVKGAALFLPRGNGSSTPRISHRRNKHAGDLQQHLQAMFILLRPEDNIRLAVRLESTYQNRTRYMVVVSTNGRQDTEESIVLGMDFSSNDSSVCTMGLVLPLWSDALIHLDGDGGFSVSTDNRIHIFKPVSVQAMWSALQSLHKACEVARIHNYYPGSLFLTWVSYYESHINSDQSSVNEWNAMQDVQSHRPDSPALFTDVPTERERTERLIKTKLREIMMQKDLENITSKEIRTELEMQMACNLREFKEFIDNEMIVILGQMDSPTQIFDHVFLGSEWNASNLEDLQNRGVRYILNVTREIDNFFPGVFEYHNIRVYDEEATDLLAYWNDTYKFISKAKKNGSKCLVHCKMGVSRSASTVIAYAMKEYGWNLDRAYDYVKERRTVTKPNPSFMRQLEEYQGILLASKQRHNKLWRSHSDSDLSDHHEPMGKSGMEVSKKEITTSADQISENKISNCLQHAPALPGLPTSPPLEPLCHSGPNLLGNLCNKERVIQLEISSRDYNTEQMEDKLNLNNLNGCPSGCCLDDASFPLDNCDASDALLQQGGALEVGAGFPDLAVEDLESDALKQGDGNVHLMPMEELESCLRVVSEQNSPSPPTPAIVSTQPEGEETDFGADRIDFFSALEKFVELSQESRPRTCSHSRTEEQVSNRNGLSRISALELSPLEPTEEARPRNNSAGNSPQASEESSLEEDQLKVCGLTRSHSENAISVKEIVTEIESIHQGAGQAKTDALNNPVPVPKRNTVHELPAESIWTWESKPGKAEPGEGGISIPKEVVRDLPLKPDQELVSASQVPSSKPDPEESSDLAEGRAEGHINPGPKWCPGSVRRATLEFEERLRQEQELQNACPVAALPTRKNSKNESTAADLSVKGKNEEPSQEQAQLSKEASRAVSAGNNGSHSEQSTERPSSPSLSSELTWLAKEQRTMVSVESQEKSSAPCRLLLPKRIEIIEYTHAVRTLDVTTADRSGTQEALEKTKVGATSPVVDENCNAASCSQDLVEASLSLRPSELSSGNLKKVVFSLGSPEELAKEEKTLGTASLCTKQARCPPVPCWDCPPLFRLEGVTRDSSSSDPDPAPRKGYAGNGQFAFKERGGALRRGSEGTLTHWSQEDFVSPRTLGAMAAGRPPEASATSPLCLLLPRRFSGGDLKGSQRHAEESDTRVRQAGLTTPSHMKRSASLAKLDRLNLSKGDLSRRDALPALGYGDPVSPAILSPQPTVHLMEPLKLTERIALSSPVERPLVQYTKEFSPSQTLPDAKLTSTQTAAVPSVSSAVPALPRYPHSRTRPPRRPRKASDRKRTTNPLYNTM
nr:PREDICTED: protein phosphatase Slingshot homolog 2 isoform X1 [Anolis carolinensis]|eukprot:XP_008118545.1 PREDICTED: protein phosphatase Slingshot homolog 2 isoform X1 [Anolis carolinensis]